VVVVVVRGKVVLVKWKGNPVPLSVGGMNVLFVVGAAPPGSLLGGEVKKNIKGRCE